MLSKEDLKEIEQSFNNSKSKDVIKSMLIVVCTFIIVYSIFY